LEAEMPVQLIERPQMNNPSPVTTKAISEDVVGVESPLLLREDLERRAAWTVVWWAAARGNRRRARESGANKRSPCLKHGEGFPLESLIFATFGPLWVGGHLF